MTNQGLACSKLTDSGPSAWVVDVGRWTEITYLFRFESLAERERLNRRILRDRTRGSMGNKVGEFTDEVTTRLLIPAPFAKASGETPAKPASSAVAAAPGGDRPRVYVAGFADRYHSANCGWVALGEETLLSTCRAGSRCRISEARHRPTGKPAGRSC